MSKLKQKQSLRHVRNGGERGVIIPLLAFITLAIFIIIVVLGIDATVVKYSSVLLRAEANQICSALVAGPPSSSGDITQAFVTSVNKYAQENNGGMVTLSEANLILPSLTDYTGGPLNAIPNSFSKPDQDLTNVNFPPHSSAGTVARLCNGTLTTTEACALNGGWCDNPANSCNFQVSVHNAIAATTETMAEKYPISLFNGLWDAGNVVGCELKAKVSTFFSLPREREISARSIFWRPALGPTNWRTGDPSTDFTNLPVPGLSIAVATEMTTDANELRFQIPLGAAWDPYRPDPDPNPVTGKSFTRPPYGHNAHSAGNIMPLLTNLTGADQTQMMAACINLPTLVRNAYLTSIVELASRHGHFRNTTEILNINPQHRGPKEGSALLKEDTSRAINFPSLMVGFGADLASRAFQLPYVSYYGGMVEEGSDPALPSISNIFVDLPSEFGVPVGQGDRIADGFLQPFSLAGDPSWKLGPGDSGHSDETLRMHSLLASQLRYCYHLYASGNANRFYGLDLSSAYSPTYEPPTFPFFADSGFAPAHVRVAYAGLDTWDQNCPWDSSPSPPFFPWLAPPIACSSPSSTGTTGYLNASELVGTLGTTQTCPFELEHGIAGLTPAVCRKPLNTWNPGATVVKEVATNDLRPDIFGSLLYLAGISRNPFPIPVGGGSDIPIPVINPPGIFRLNLDENTGNPGWSGLVNATLPFIPSEYQTRLVNSSSILLVLHQRLNNPTVGACKTCTDCAGSDSEYCKIRCLVESDALKSPNPSPPYNLRRRPILIAYFPTTYLDDQAAQSVGCAFMAQTDRTLKDENLIEIFSPRVDEDFYNSTLGAGCDSLGAANESLCFTAYWKYLLEQRLPADPIDPDKNVVKLAKIDFVERLTTQAIKY